MWHYGITQSQRCNNDNVYNYNNLMHARVRFFDEFFDDFFNVKTHDIWEINVTMKNGNLIENIRSLGLLDIRGEATLRTRLILWS